MSAPSAANLMTTEQLLAMPEDGMDRDLIRGELRERPMTRRTDCTHGRNRECLIS
jgi:hypothetical protein